MIDFLSNLLSINVKCKEWCATTDSVKVIFVNCASNISQIFSAIENIHISGDVEEDVLKFLRWSRTSLGVYVGGNYSFIV